MLTIEASHGSAPRPAHPRLGAGALALRDAPRRAPRHRRFPAELRRRPAVAPLGRGAPRSPEVQRLPGLRPVRRGRRRRHGPLGGPPPRRHRPDARHPPEHPPPPPPPPTLLPHPTPP